jgi:SAM-dependent methyltransferase
VVEWYEEFFDELAHDVWRALVPDSHSDAEVALLVDALRLPVEGGDVLDVPSGDGRIARRLAALGHRVTAVDLSPVAVERLRSAGPAVEVVLGDMRDLAHVLAPGTVFDGACCLGNSFAYLDDAGTLDLLRGVVGHLAPGARFLVDAPAAAECVLVHLAASDVHRSGDVTLEIETDYDARTSTLVGRMTMTRGAESATRRVVHRVRTSGRIVELFEEAGLSVLELLGGVDRSPFRVGSPTLLVLAERRA